MSRLARIAKTARVCTALALLARPIGDLGVLNAGKEVIGAVLTGGASGLARSWLTPQVPPLSYNFANHVNFAPIVAVWPLSV